MAYDNYLACPARPILLPCSLHRDRRPPGTHLLLLLLGLYPLCQRTLCPHSSPATIAGPSDSMCGPSDMQPRGVGYGSVRGREALTHAGNFCFFRVCCSLRRVAWRGNDTTRLQANQGTPTPTRVAIPKTESSRSIRHLAVRSPDFLELGGGTSSGPRSTS